MSAVVGYPSDSHPKGVYHVEPRACCLRCKANVAVMVNRDLRPHKHYVKRDLRIVRIEWCR